MSLKLRVVALLIAFHVLGTQAGVLRIDSNSNAAVHKSAAQLAADALAEDTTFKAKPEELERPNVALSRDEDASIKITEATLNPAPGSEDDIEVTLVTVEKLDSENADEGLAQAAESEPSTVRVLLNDGSEVTLSNDDAQSNSEFSPEVANSAEAPAKPVAMFEKLLLLSTPKISEKAKIDEENIEEPAEEPLFSTTESSADEQPAESTTTTADEEQTEKHETSSEEEKGGVLSFVTKLFATNKSNDKPTAAADADTSKAAQNQNAEKPQAADDTESKQSDDKPATAAEASSEPHNDNVASAVLIETEADYVLVDADAEQFGTFTHADSAEHLQPIVQSVEIVPTSFHDPLVLNYVHHHW